MQETALARSTIGINPLDLSPHPTTSEDTRVDPPAQAGESSDLIDPTAVEYRCLGRVHRRHPERVV